MSQIFVIEINIKKSCIIIIILIANSIIISVQYHEWYHTLLTQCREAKHRCGFLLFDTISQKITWVGTLNPCIIDILLEHHVTRLYHKVIAIIYSNMKIKSTQ